MVSGDADAAVSPGRYRSMARSDAAGIVRLTGSLNTTAPAGIIVTQLPANVSMRFESGTIAAPLCCLTLPRRHARHDGGGPRADPMLAAARALRECRRLRATQVYREGRARNHPPRPECPSSLTDHPCRFHDWLLRAGTNR